MLPTQSTNPEFRGRAETRNSHHVGRSYESTAFGGGGCPGLESNAAPFLAAARAAGPAPKPATSLAGLPVAHPFHSAADRLPAADREPVVVTPPATTGHLNLKWTMADVDLVRKYSRKGHSASLILVALRSASVGHHDTTLDELLAFCDRNHIFVRSKAGAA